MFSSNTHFQHKFAGLTSLIYWAVFSTGAYAESPVNVDANFVDESLDRSTQRVDPPFSRETDVEAWTVHGQSTYIAQQKNNFNSAYYGKNSLWNKSEGGGNSYSFSATAYLGARLWQGAEVYYNPEMYQGTPFNGQLVGLGGFQNGELQKGSYLSPVTYTSRAFIRQTYGLGGGNENIESGPNQLKGSADKNRVVVSYGKFSTLDFFDQNSYSHDPRTQFQNFSIFSMGAYGYAADTKGFTYGAVVEWFQDDWIVKAARLAMPTLPNTAQLDYSLAKDYGDQIELTHEHKLSGRHGAIRGLYYQQNAYMANYQNSMNVARQTNSIPSILDVRQAGQRSWGYGLNIEQSINDDVGIFSRWSWNPGKTETQTLDISHSLSGGLSVKGAGWGRGNDTLGVGYAINGISASEINYLQRGGMTAFIGDGALAYKAEKVFETYYSAKAYKNLYVSADYQRIANPAFNAARGPVNFFGIRVHVEI